MLRTVKPSVATAISDESRTRIVADLKRILTAQGQTEIAGTRSHQCEVARCNVRRGLNRCVETLVLLLTQNGEAEAFAGAVVALLAPQSTVPTLTLKAALVLECRAQCAADLPETDLLAGDDSAVELAAFARSSRTHERAIHTARLLAEAQLHRMAA